MRSQSKIVAEIIKNPIWSFQTPQWFGWSSISWWTELEKVGWSEDWGVVNNFYRPRCGIRLRNQHTIRGWDGIWHPVWDWNRLAWRKGGKAEIWTENRRDLSPLSCLGGFQLPQIPPLFCHLDESSCLASASWTLLHPQSDLHPSSPRPRSPGRSGEAPVHGKNEKQDFWEHCCRWLESGNVIT